MKCEQRFQEIENTPRAKLHIPNFTLNEHDVFNIIGCYYYAMYSNSVATQRHYNHHSIARGYKLRHEKPSVAVLLSFTVLMFLLL